MSKFKNIKKGDNVFVFTSYNNNFAEGFFGVFQEETNEGVYVLRTHGSFGEPLHPTCVNTNIYPKEDIEDAVYVLNDNIDWLEEKLNYIKAFKEELCTKDVKDN